MGQISMYDIYKKKFFDNKDPVCCTQQEFEEWCKSAIRCEYTQADKKIHFCDDCDARYQNIMIEKGNCTNPNRIFPIIEIKD